jgi:hypothetical protein
MSLLDKLSQIQQQKAQAPAPGATQNLQSLLQTKMTGKVSAPTGPTMSTTGENQAIANQSAQASQLQQQANQAVAAQRQQEQQQIQAYNLEQQKLTQQRQSMSSRAAREADKIAQDLKRSGMKLESDRKNFDLARLMLSRIISIWIDWKLKVTRRDSRMM